MSVASPLAARLRPGLDSNDSSWSIIRGDDAWRAGVATGVAYDDAAGGLVLAQRVRHELADWLASAPVQAPDGSWFQSDTANNRLLRRGPCDSDFAPVPRVGGGGYATGHMNAPAGIAIDGQGRVYVADSGNARVQVVLPASGEVEAVLSEGLVRPVAIAIADDGTVFVADPGTGRIHPFSPRFAPRPSLKLATIDPWTRALWDGGPAPQPMGVAARPDGSIAIFDPGRSLLWHMSACGEPLVALPWPGGDALPAGWPATPARFEREGEIMLGPIDSGSYNFAWHRILADADLPAGSTLRLQTFAANRSDAAPLVWAPRAPTAIPAAEADIAVGIEGGEYDRLVLPDPHGWQRWKMGGLLRAQPPVHDFATDGPVGADSFTLPIAAARRVQVGDRVVFTTPAGGTADAVITEAADWDVSIAASGPDAAFAEAPRLAERDGAALAYGAIDLAFLGGAAAPGLGGLARDGRPEPAALPHALAAFLEPGDLVRLGSGRFELVETLSETVAFRLDQAVPGDFSASTLTVADAGRRLLVGDALSESGPLPAQTRLAVLGEVHGDTAEAPWVDAATGTIWLAPGSLPGPVGTGNWVSAQFPEPGATDRGRFLWVRLLLGGAPAPAPETESAAATPLVRALRLTGPRPALTEWLPALFSRRDPETEPPGANFLERFLTLFEGEFTRMEGAFESVSRLLNPAAADPEWLAFVASWLDLAFDPSWPVERRRALVREGAALQAGRGTPAALARYLEIYTGTAPTIIEGFTKRPPLPIQLGARGALGVAPLGGKASDARAAEDFAHRFTVTVMLPQGDARTVARSTVLRIIESMKPAHTVFTLDTGRGGDGRIGLDGKVGGVVIPGPEAADPCACEPDGANVQRGRVAGGFKLGGRLGRAGTLETGIQGD
jgi:phage tail-like protein